MTARARTTGVRTRHPTVSGLVEDGQARGRVARRRLGEGQQRLQPGTSMFAPAETHRPRRSRIAGMASRRDPGGSPPRPRRRTPARRRSGCRNGPPRRWPRPPSGPPRRGSRCAARCGPGAPRRRRGADGCRAPAPAGRTARGWRRRFVGRSAARGPRPASVGRRTRPTCRRPWPRPWPRRRNRRLVHSRCADPEGAQQGQAPRQMAIVSEVLGAAIRSTVVSSDVPEPAGAERGVGRSPVAAQPVAVGQAAASSRRPARRWRRPRRSDRAAPRRAGAIPASDHSDARRRWRRPSRSRPRRLSWSRSSRASHACWPRPVRCGSASAASRRSQARCASAERPRPRRRWPAGRRRTAAWSRAGGSAASGGVEVGDDERLVDQPGDEVEHRVGVEVVAAGDRLGRIDREAAGEDGQSSEQPLLLVVEQAVAPLDRRLQGLLPGERPPAPTGQEAEPVVEPGGDAFGAHHAHPGRGQLDAEREAVEPTADAGHRGRDLVRQPEPGRDCWARATNSCTAGAAWMSPRRRRERGRRGRGSATTTRRPHRSAHGWSRPPGRGRAGQHGASTSSAHASSRCSALSSTIVADRFASACTSTSIGRWSTARSPRDASTSATTRRGLGQRGEIDPPHPVGVGGQACVGQRRGRGGSCPRPRSR